MADEGARTVVSLQGCRSGNNYTGSNAACVRSAQAAVLRKATNDRAKFQRLELESRLEISTWEGLGREQVLWEVIWAKRQLEVPIWEPRCRKAMLPVYWDRVEQVGRWAIDTLQWKLNKRILLQHQSNWNRGWLPHRAQEEAVKLWVQDGDRWSGLVCWHIQGLERNARRKLPA